MVTRRGKNGSSQLDPELRILLRALAEGQVKLSEGLSSHEVLLAKLAEGQTELAAGQRELTRAQQRTEMTVQQLAHDMHAFADVTATAIERLAVRMDGYTEAVMRGLTSGVERDGKLEARVDGLEARLTALEQKQSS